METLLPVSVIGALLVFLLKIWFERTSIQSALLADVNLTLQRARETMESLDGDDHYWLKVGTVLSRSPLDVELKSSIFIAVLPKIYLLGPASVARILTFYSHYQLCDGLKKSLFHHIEVHAKSQKPLTETDVNLLQLRKARVYSGFASLLRHPGQIRIATLRDLQLEYEIPSTKDVAEKVNLALSTGDKKLLLPD
jgi:hypothetical protein